MMQSWRRVGRAVAAALVSLLMLLAPVCAAAQVSDGVVKLGLILDLSGPYSDVTGTGTVAAVKMAIEDIGGRVLDAPIVLLVADHQNKTDRAAAIARDWFATQQVDAIADVSGSSEALQVQRIAANRDRIALLSGPGAERLTNEACTATAVHYVFDTYSIAHTVGAAMVDRGARTWFFVTVDSSFGYDLENATAAVVRQHGGEVLGRARHPLGAPEFASYLGRAQESGARVIGLADAGGDLIALIKEAARAGMTPGPQIFAGLAMRINAVHQLGLEASQGMMLGESFYWDLNDATRAWSQRFFAAVGKMPNSLQAGAYSSTMHYLRAVQAASTDATEPVMAAMRATPIHDFFAPDGHIRADGLMVHDTYLLQVKAPSESRYAWDYLKPVAKIPGESAFPPLSQSRCPLIKK